jgi:plastocyanin
MGNGGAREAVIYLEGGQKAVPLPHAMVDQRNKTFVPHVSVVTVGTTVRFPNDDTVFHNVFAYFQAKRFDLGIYPRGASKSETFDKPGLVALLCNIHSNMSAYIVVVDTPYYAVSDSSGRFLIREFRRARTIPRGKSWRLIPCLAR